MSSQNVHPFVARAAKIKWDPGESFFALFLGFTVAMVGGWELAWLAFRGFADPAMFLCFGTPFGLMLAGAFRAVHAQAKRKPRFWQAIGWTASIAFTLTAELHYAKNSQEFGFLARRPVVFTFSPNTKVYSFPADFKAICEQAKAELKPKGFEVADNGVKQGKIWTTNSIHFPDSEEYRSIEISPGRAVGSNWSQNGEQFTDIHKAKGWVTIEVYRWTSWVEGFAP